MRTTKQKRIMAALALLGLTYLLVVRLILDRSAACLFTPAPSALPLRLRSPVEIALREARQYHTRAKVAVNQEREALGAWDPEAAAEVDPESERLQLMAVSPDLARARVAARQAAALARTGEEASQAAELLSLIEHEAGHHEAELQWAQDLVRLQPRSERAWMVLQRALRCPERRRLRRSAAAIAGSRSPLTGSPKPARHRPLGHDGVPTHSARDSALSVRHPCSTALQPVRARAPGRLAISNTSEARGGTGARGAGGMGPGGEPGRS